MNIGFRTDASLTIGNGHVMRCLTLADALKERGSQCHFFCRTHPGHLGAMIVARGHRLTLLPQASGAGQTAGAIRHASWLGCHWREDARQTVVALDGLRLDWLIVDHYALDAAWETELCPHFKRLMVIDDLADRSHAADLLLDQNLGRSGNDYDGLVPQGCRRLMGPHYALLRPQFAALRESSLTRRVNPSLRRIMIGMGGVDAENMTGKALAALRTAALPEDCQLTVVMGRHAPWLESVRDEAGRSRWPCEVRVDADDIAQIMARSDLAIGAAGTTVWERCCLGLPAMLFVLAGNQRESAGHVAKAGAALLLTDPDELPSLFATHFDRDVLVRMSDAAASICDGGGCERVVDVLLQFEPAAIGRFRIRPMAVGDLEQVLEWRNHPEIRKHMFTRHQITPAEHRAWFMRSQEDRTNHLLIFEADGRACGFVHLRELERTGTAEWGFYVMPGAPAGTGRKLGHATLAYAFDTLGLDELHGQALSSNERSIAFHRALGFTGEGSPTLAGDEAVFGFRLLASDWRRNHIDRGHDKNGCN
jgi:UDP-2,4-diacetamido-2,4,6-trideoxy-beta-L-altropyranose hydrolase/UDP-4-amino-4,6-dideoxy-N-acetyl-beta-L-altrosamine N-acetyltransferase